VVTKGQVSLDADVLRKGKQSAVTVVALTKWAEDHGAVLTFTRRYPVLMGGSCHQQGRSLASDGSLDENVRLCLYSLEHSTVVTYVQVLKEN